MKNNRITLAILCAFTLIIFVPGPAAATVVGSSHDFTGGGMSGFQSPNEDEVCIFCHTPHGGVATEGAPLWNKTLNAGETFTMYDSLTFNGDTSYVGDRPTGMSLICLSCHDGVSTINSVLNYTIDGEPQMDVNYNSLIDVDVPGYAPYRNPVMGRDLSNDHPVSFIYNQTLIDADTTSRGNGVIGLNSPTPASNIAPLLLYNTRLECPTCHDPHEEGSPDKFPYLRMSNAGSAMCLKCHIK